MTQEPSATNGGKHRNTPREVGDQVSDFELPGAGENGIEEFSLYDYTETGPVILSFYPFDFSPICTSHLCAFRDAEWLTVNENVDVLGISVDSAYAHQKFREEYDLPFPLLTDRLASVAEQFGVKYDEWKDHPAVCKRAMFAIDDTNTIRYRWYTEDAMNAPSFSELKATINWADH